MTPKTNTNISGRPSPATIHDALCQYLRFFATSELTSTVDLRTLADLLPAYQLVPEWIRANRPPNDERVVTVAYKVEGDEDYTIDSGYFDHVDSIWRLTGGDEPLAPVLFWTEHPAPPDRMDEQASTLAEAA